MLHLSQCLQIYFLSRFFFKKRKKKSFEKENDRTRDFSTPQFHEIDVNTHEIWEVCEKKIKFWKNIRIKTSFVIQCDFFLLFCVQRKWNFEWMNWEIFPRKWNWPPRNLLTGRWPFRKTAYQDDGWNRQQQRWTLPRNCESVSLH